MNKTPLFQYICQVINCIQLDSNDTYVQGRQDLKSDSFLLQSLVYLLNLAFSTRPCLCPPSYPKWEKFLEIFFLKYFYWSIANLQSCISFWCTAKWLRYNHIYLIIYLCVLSCFSRAQLFSTPWTVTLQAPLSMGFSRQEYWSGLPCPPWGSSWPRDRTHISYISCVDRRILYP